MSLWGFPTMTSVSANSVQQQGCAWLQVGIAACCGLLAARGFQACNPRESLKLSTVLSPYLAGAERDHVQLCAAALT